MEIQEAIEILKTHNKWRRGDLNIEFMMDPKDIGLAIDTVAEYFEKLVRQNE